MNPQSGNYIEDYKVLSLIGDGGQAKVYLCSRDHDDQLVAIKVYESGMTKKESFKKEVKFLETLRCVNLINIIDSKIDAKVKVDATAECIRPIVILEYAEKCQLFSYVTNKGGFSAEMCRALIKKLLNAIQYMHQKGVTHRDLKLENILFDQNYELKVSDFGLSTTIQGSDGDGILKSKVGTEGFRPPEMEKGNYTGIQSDIFAIGVILFILYAGSPPFLSTKFSDKVYKRIREGRFDSFWNLHEKKKEENYFPESFKNLMNSFLNANPSNRPSFESLRDDEWLNGTEASSECFKSQMKARFQEILNEDEHANSIHELIETFKEQYPKNSKNLQEKMNIANNKKQTTFSEQTTQ